jgi:hypothetical protein
MTDEKVNNVIITKPSGSRARLKLQYRLVSQENRTFFVVSALN